MKLAFDIPDGHDGGDCFETAAQNVIDNKDWLCVHGIVNGQGALTGVKFPHAWNEVDGDVIDMSNGNDICMPIPLYYSLGVEDWSVVGYDYKEVLENIVETGHWGPWAEHLDFDYRFTGMKRNAYELDETNTGGDCFESAYNDFMESQDDWGSTTYLCHGVVRGKGKLEGLLLSHAWTETYSDEWIPIAADYSQGNEIVMPVYQYYDAVDVVPGSVEKYDDEWEVESLIAANGHLGPWHIDWYIKDAETGEIIDGVV